MAREKYEVAAKQEIYYHLFTKLQDNSFGFHIRALSHDMEMGSNYKMRN